MRFELRGRSRPTTWRSSRSTTSPSPTSSVQWPFRRSLHAQRIDRAPPRRRAADRLRRPVHRADQPSARTSRCSTPSAARATSCSRPTESDDRGGTRVLGGDENLAHASARTPPQRTSPTDRGGVIRRFPAAAGGLPTLAVAAAGLVGGACVPAARLRRRRRLDRLPRPAGHLPDLVVLRRPRRPGRPERSPRPHRRRRRDRARRCRTSTRPRPPSDRLMSGPEIQANAIWTALHRIPLRDAPGWARPARDPAARRRARFRRPAHRAPLAAASPSPVARRRLRRRRAARLRRAGGWSPVAEPLFALVLSTAEHDRRRHAPSAASAAGSREHNDLLEQRVRERTAELRDTQLEIVRRLAPGRRVARRRHRRAHRAHEPPLRAARARARPERGRGRAARATPARCTTSARSAIPDSVLLKPGALDADECDADAAHTTSARRSSPARARRCCRSPSRSR